MPDIEMLQALHGDAFILHCQKGNNKGVVVVDGGPNKKSRNIVTRLDALGMIDLMILTHYDDDHIGGLLAYLNKHKNDRPFPVKQMWLNCAYNIQTYSSSNISFGQAQKLADKLSDINKDLSKEGFPTIEWEHPIEVSKMPISLPFADFLILSPSEKIRLANDKNYNATISNTNIGRNYTRQKVAFDKSLLELSLNKKNKPNEDDIHTVTNCSSIAFVVGCDNFSALMLGDSFPCTIVNSLKNLGYGIDNPLHVDFVKISHHGSCNNISNELLDMVDCDKFLISTNGGNGVSCHPDRETIANIVCHKKRDMSKPVHLYFNYPIKTIEKIGYKFMKENEVQHYNIVIHENEY